MRYPPFALIWQKDIGKITILAYNVRFSVEFLSAEQAHVQNLSGYRKAPDER